MGHEGYSWFQKENKKHESDPSVSSTPSIWFTFLLRGQLQGSVRVRSMKVSTNQWHNYGSVHLAIFDHLWVFEIVSGLNSVERTNSEEAERGGGRIWEKREKGAMITLILSLLTLFLICETISPIYNFEKLLRELTISDFYWLKTYRVWCIVL